MNLNNLLSKVKIKKIIGNANIDISKIAINSLDVEKGGLFVAINGYNDNGNNYVLDAVNRGAVAILSNTESNVKVTQIIVEDVRDELSNIIKEFYQINKLKIRFIGIVGTNGKTTTSYIVKSILEKDGKKVGIVGTLGILYSNKFIAPELTTPDSVSLAETFIDMQKCGVEYVVMELSAHAIEQKRAKFIKFDSLIFTNCTEDHLDYFKNMDYYAKVKKSVFNSKYCKFATVNIDDSYGLEIVKSNKVKCFTYGIENPSDVFSIGLKNSMPPSSTLYGTAALNAQITAPTQSLPIFIIKPDTWPSLVLMPFSRPVTVTYRPSPSVSPCIWVKKRSNEPSQSL